MEQAVRDKLPTQISFNCVWALSEGPLGLERAAVFKVRWQWCGPFAFFLRKGVDFLRFELFL
jgi:hypothetical protein